MRVGKGAWIAGGISLAAVAALLFWPKRRAVALVGDSLAVGLGPPMGKLAAADGVPFQYQAVGGTTPAQWAAQASACGPCGRWLAGFRPSVILVVLGTNDIGYGVPPAAPYRELVARWGAIGQVVWVEPPMMPGDRLAAVRATIASLGVPILPATEGLSFASDNIHPTNYPSWAKTLWSQLAP